jgi:hypothetical protein
MYRRETPSPGVCLAKFLDVVSQIFIYLPMLHLILPSARLLLGYKQDTADSEGLIKSK